MKGGERRQRRAGSRLGREHGRGRRGAGRRRLPRRLFSFPDGCRRPNRGHDGERGACAGALHGHERHRGHRDHQHEGAGRGRVPHARGSPPEQHVQARQQRRRERKLPKRVQEGPTQGDRDRMADQLGKAHLPPPSMSSSTCRMRAISAAEAFRSASACITSFMAEPSKARSRRSRTSCRCVCASASRAK